VPSSQKSWIGAAYQASRFSLSPNKMTKSLNTHANIRRISFVLADSTLAPPLSLPLPPPFLPLAHPLPFLSPEEDVQGTYYYPHPPHGYTGISSPTSRPLDPSQGETSEWILLDSTPATCANIALHNLFPEGIDLLISGPNHGRNSSSAFSISSGTMYVSEARLMRDVGDFVLMITTS
jgi:5'/3'-nucleotidase SurE